MFTPFQSASYEPLNNGILEGLNSQKQAPHSASKPTNKRHKKSPKPIQAMRNKRANAQNSDQTGYDTLSSEARKSIPRKVKNLCRVLGFVKNENNFVKKVERLKLHTRSRILKNIIPQYVSSSFVDPFINVDF